MIEDRHEELASLYAFDLLEGQERDQFESALARNGELQSLVRDLKETACRLAFTAPLTTPPPDLKLRVIASASNLGRRGADNVIRPSASLWRFVPWAIAACLTLTSAWLGQRFASTRTELATIRSRQELAEISFQSTQQQLEAERILSQRRVEDSERLLASLNRELGTARTSLAERDRQLADSRAQAASLDLQLGEARIQLASLQTHLNDREIRMATLTERIDALAGASAEADKQLGDARQRIAQLNDQLRTQGDLANLKITALASMLKALPQAQAIAVWDPKKQEGILDVQKLPALAANEDYQIWVVDPQYPIPVDGGVFSVEPTSGVSRVKFTAKQPVNVINAFAVTRERKGGVPKAEGPFVLLGK
jgi:anti-sigma-K factor RskA